MARDIEKVNRTHCHLAKRPLGGSARMDMECGDDGMIKKLDEDTLFIALVDALGHGGDAHAIALICVNYLRKNCSGDLIETMEGLHKYIKSLNKGAVVCICRLDLKNGELRYVGAGNISMKRFGSSRTRVIYKNGIVGYTIPRQMEEMMVLRGGDVLVLHTDGVKENFDESDYPELLKDDVKEIAETIVNRFGRKDDDAACLALRYER